MLLSQLVVRVHQPNYLSTFNRCCHQPIYLSATVNSYCDKPNPSTKLPSNAKTLCYYRQMLKIVDKIYLEITKLLVSNGNGKDIMSTKLC